MFSYTYYSNNFNLTWLGNWYIIAFHGHWDLGASHHRKQKEVDQLTNPKPARTHAHTVVNYNRVHIQTARTRYTFKLYVLKNADMKSPCGFVHIYKMCSRLGIRRKCRNGSGEGHLYTTNEY